MEKINEMAALRLKIHHSFIPYENDSEDMDEDRITVLYTQGYDCAQCILRMFEDRIDCDMDTAMRTISCMGMGLLEGSLCGALLGAFAVIGLKYGTTSPDMAAKGMSIIKRAQFMIEFKKKYSGMTCPELMGLDVRKDEDNLRAYKEGIYEHFCPNLGKDIVEILEKIL